MQQHESGRRRYSVGLPNRSQRLVFRALVAVLQIGNVSFVDSHTDAGDTVSVEELTRAGLNDAAKLLSLDGKLLESVLLTRRMGAGGGRSVVTVQYTKAQAADARTQSLFPLGGPPL